MRSGRGLLEIALARPDRSNALDATLISELLAELAGANHDAPVRFITLRGEGRNFCAGADIKAGRAEANDAESARSGPSLAELLLRWDAFSKPTAAFVHGACLGAGLALASCCDVVIASPDSFFAVPEVRLGMAPGLLPFFVRALGSRAFRRYGLSGERFDARAALSCGLVSEIVDIADWDQTQARLHDSFLHAAPDALATIKAEAARLEEIMIDPEPLLARRQNPESAEAAEGKASFREKRKPAWYLND